VILEEGASYTLVMSEYAADIDVGDTISYFVA